MRIRSLDHFRALAIVLVLARHAWLMFEWDMDSVGARSVMTVIAHGTVLFVFIAGNLFQHLLSRFELRSYLRRKLLNVVIPYIVCSVPTLAHQFGFRWGVFERDAARHGWGLVGALVHALATGSHMAIPFWFMPMIFAVYLLAPALVWIDAHPRAYLLVPPLLLMASFAHRPHVMLGVQRNLAFYLPIYLLGMACSRYRSRVIAAVQAHGVALAAAIGALMLVDGLWGLPGALTSHKPFTAEQGLIDLNYLGKALLSVGLLGWLQQVQPRVSDWMDRILGKLAEYSFGLYFVHMYFVDHPWAFFEVRFLGGRLQGTVLGYLLAVFALVVVSYGAVWSVKKLTGKRSRLLIGC